MRDVEQLDLQKNANRETQCVKTETNADQCYVLTV